MGVKMITVIQLGHLLQSCIEVHPIGFPQTFYLRSKRCEQFFLSNTT